MSEEIKPEKNNEIKPVLLSFDDFVAATETHPPWPRSGQTVVGFLEVEYIGKHWDDEPDLIFHPLVPTSKDAEFVYATEEGLSLRFLMGYDSVPHASGFYHIMMTFHMEKDYDWETGGTEWNYYWEVKRLQFIGSAINLEDLCPLS